MKNLYSLDGLATQTFSRRRGHAELVLAAVLFGLMAYLTKRATDRISGPETAFFRFAIGLAIVLGQARVRRAPLTAVRRDLVLMRGFFGGIAVLLYFVTIAHLPVGTATLLNYTAPIFTSTFSAIFLAEALPGAGILALGVACAGVALVVYGQGKVLGGGYGWQALGLGAAVLSGAAVTTIRASRRTDSAMVVFGSFCLVGMIATVPFTAASWRTPSFEVCGLLLGIGIIAAIAQILMTHALAVVDATTAGIISQLTVVTALGLGHFCDGEPFSTLSLAGATLTLLGVTLATSLGHHRT